MEAFFDSNYYPKFGDITEDYWNDSGITRNLFSEEDEVLVYDELFQPDTDGNASKAISCLPIQSLITEENLELILQDTCSKAVVVPQSIEECIDYLFSGKNCNLYDYKSLEDKTNLLDKALHTYDGNVIMTVILFLENTLNFNIFLQILLNKKLAMDQYCYFLLNNYNTQRLHSIQMVASDYLDMMDLFYSSVRHNDSSEDLKQKLQRLMTEFSGSIIYEKEILSNYNTYLDFKIAKRIHSKSAIELLSLQMKENLEKQGTIDSTETTDLKNSLKISEFQYDWVKLNVLAKLTMWNKILEFYVHTNRFTRKKEIKSLLGKDLLLLNLHKREAPKHVLEGILSAMPLDEFTLYWAQKTKCYRYVIDYYAAQKDRLSLIQSQASLSRNSEEYLHAEAILKSDRRWKN